MLRRLLSSCEQEYITDISELMLDDASKLKCRANPDNYWGVLDLAYVEKYLGTRMYSNSDLSTLTYDQNNALSAEFATYITDETFMFRDDFQHSNCS